MCLFRTGINLHLHWSSPSDLVREGLFTPASNCVHTSLIHHLLSDLSSLLHMQTVSYVLLFLANPQTIVSVLIYLYRGGKRVGAGWAV